MNDISVRNVVVIVAAVVIGLVVLGFVGSLLNNIIPLAIVAVIAFILGRTSNRVDYLRLGRDAAKRVRTATEAVVDQAATRAQTRQQAQGQGPQAQAANRQLADEARTGVEQAAAKAEAKAADRLAEVETPAEDDLTANPDLEVKTVQQIQAEARLVEQEATKKAQAMDVQAALEERRKRLLGGKED